MSLNLVLFYESSALAAPLLSLTNSTVDGAVGMGTQIPSSPLVGVALRELTHAMGREASVGPSFATPARTTPILHLFSGFSIDGGSTKLADFGQTSDSSDFLNCGVQGTNDPYNEFYNGSTIQMASEALQGGTAVTLLGGPPTIMDSASTA